MRSILFLIMILLVAGCSDTSCDIYKPAAQQNVLAKGTNVLLSQYIGAENFSAETSVDAIIKAIEESTTELYTAETQCVDSTSVYFNVYIQGHQDFALNGLVSLENDKYLSGPFLLPSQETKNEAVFIQADGSFND